MRPLQKGLVFLLFAGCLATTARGADEKKEEGFKPLWNGKDLSDFGIVGTPASTWSVEDRVIQCTGKPHGYIYTKKSYTNYILRLDMRYPKKAGNSGFLIHITGKHKVFPKCIEVQGHYGGLCSIFPIGGAKGPRPKADSAARKKAIKPHDQWNSIEIIVKNGAITAFINGTKISQSEPYELKEGPIGFQSEGAPIEFRNLRIKELP
jgi:hypothetical protein